MVSLPLDQLLSTTRLTSCRARAASRSLFVSTKERIKTGPLLADDGDCFSPCSKMTFNSRLTGFDQRKKKLGIFIQYEEKMKTVGVSFIINEITLLTRIGGIIGVGKEILWAIVFFIGLLKISMIKIKNLIFLKLLLKNLFFKNVSP